jgi:hypothetical protein
MDIWLYGLLNFSLFFRHKIEVIATAFYTETVNPFSRGNPTKLTQQSKTDATPSIKSFKARHGGMKCLRA